MYLGKLISNFRQEKNMSMDEFAKLANLSKPYISMLEKNKNSRNGKPIVPSVMTLKKVSKVLNISFDDLIKMLDSGQEIALSEHHTEVGRGVRIPVLGRVVAGIPIEAIQEILDYEEIPQSMADTGDFFALRVRGDSMLPTLKDGDVVIVKKQPTVDSGDIAIVLVNGNDATVKEIKESTAGITLIGHNVAVYTPQFYSNEDIKNLPVQVLGKVVEMRRKF